MKRFFALTMLIFYLLPVTGMGFDLHYCGKNIRAVSFYHSNGHYCPCGDKMPDKSCCKDHFVFVKLNTGHHSSVFHSVQPGAKILYSFCLMFNSVNYSFYQKNNNFTLYHAPPLVNPEHPLYILSGSMLI